MSRICVVGRCPCGHNGGNGIKSNAPAFIPNVSFVVAKGSPPMPASFGIKNETLGINPRAKPTGVVPLRESVIGSLGVVLLGHTDGQFSWLSWS